MKALLSAPQEITLEPGNVIETRENSFYLVISYQTEIRIVSLPKGYCQVSTPISPPISITRIFSSIKEYMEYEWKRNNRES